MQGQASWLAGWRPYLLLAALCLCLYLPGIAALPVLDRDEARFAQATRQMLETGDFLHIRFQDEPRNNKPAGIYWLQALSVGAFSTPQSTAIWPYRLPSLLGATAATLLTFAFGRRLFGDPKPALAGAVLLASALGVVAEAHIAKTDAALLAAVVAGQGALGLAYCRARAGGMATPGIAATFWLAEIAAIYLKGPIGPGLATLTAATLSLADRDGGWLRGLRPLAGSAALVLAVAPWLLAIEHATEGQFLAQSVGRDFLAKVAGAQEAHGAPPLTYLALAMVSFWPGSLLLAPALIGGWRHRRVATPRFLLAWLIPGWVVLELVPTKLPHYALPLYPALALLAGMALFAGGAVPRWERLADRAVAALWGLATLLLAAALVAAPLHFAGSFAPVGIAGAALLVVLAAAAWLGHANLGHANLGRANPGRTAAVLAALAVAFVASASRVAPALGGLWLSRGAAAMVAAHPAPSGTILTAIGYDEPSLVFLLGGAVRPAAADAALPAAGEVLVSSREAAAFEHQLAAQHLGAHALDSVAGTDYSNGRQMTLTLYDIGPQRQ